MKFRKLAETFEEIESKSSKLEMTHILEELFKQATASDVGIIAYLLQGKLVPAYKGMDLGMGEKFVEIAISKATGHERKDVEKTYRETGDLGKTAEKLMSDKKQSALFTKELTVKSVYKSFEKIATSSGMGSQDTKIKIITELLNNSTPLEAKYIARFPTERLRLGVG
ncbi:MAG: DNA ligase, partial [Candidatus Diapherotrites archaeon]|nr:DNA ligase [Candidatus Diapherotrites archaeon]